jgi:hypothetical protein
MSKVFVVKNPYAPESNVIKFFVDKDYFLENIRTEIKLNGFVNLDLGYIDTDDHDLEIHPIDKETLRVIL